ncbi:MAG: response regulator transcription factor [Solirubrobacterales bacterium]|nr:response regulator transcription factor [Solirubrobacterales bacterium]MBV9471841.1 response regulator transcription factor [Solirubrobacterales bacterium]
MDSPLATILVVEDHLSTRTFLADNLAADGYEPLGAESIGDAQRLLASRFPDLAIVDLGLPDGDGLELLRAIREADRLTCRVDPDMPLLVLSGRAGELDRLRGFDRGCDDYVTKPFSYTELRARVVALLRRGRRRPGASRLRIGPLAIDAIARHVWLHDEPLALSKKEFALLRALAGDPTRVFTREELLRGVWGYRSLGATRTLDSHASRLRRKLSVKGERFVVNVWGVGYRLVDGDLEP